MNRFRGFLELAERLTIIAAAVLAFFPLYQWWQEREDRKVYRLAISMQMLGVCDNFFMTEDAGSLGRVDVFENLCAAVIQNANDTEDWLLQSDFLDAKD